jgi:hypothetical protein
MNKKYINPKTGEKYRYYDREGRGLTDVFDWAKLMEPRYYENLDEYAKYKIVKQEHTWLGFWVSTVWLGLDHAFLPTYPPLIFETMVFFRHRSDLEMDRYTTERQAKAGHKNMIRKWSNPLYVAYRILWDKSFIFRLRVERLFKKHG